MVGWLVRMSVGFINGQKNSAGPPIRPPGPYEPKIVPNVAVEPPYPLPPLALKGRGEILKFRDLVPPRLEIATRWGMGDRARLRARF